MTTRVLFLDTNVLIKLYKEESGSDIVKWLLSPSMKIKRRLYFVINNRVCEELEKKILMFGKRGILSERHSNMTIRQFNRFYKNNYFRVIGKDVISNARVAKSMADVISELNLKPGKSDWDGEHYQSLVNALAHLGGKSKPILVSSDQRFYKKVERRGFVVIDPIKHSKSVIEGMLA